MNKQIALLLLSIAHTLVSIGMWTGFSVLLYRVINKSFRDFWKNAGVKRPPKGSFSVAVRSVSLAYLFTIFMWIVLKLVNGGMQTTVLAKERAIEPLPVLVLMVLMLGLRSGFGEELFFRGLIANQLFKRMSSVKANLLQALLFMIPHIFTFSSAPGLESGLLVINAFVMGLALGYITKRSDGSIIPSMLCHASANIIACPISWLLM